MIDNHTVYLHYRISYIKNLLEKVHASEAELIDIAEFQFPYPSIYWEYPLDFISDFPTARYPVIAVEYPSPHSQYIIVDGNHRIAKAICEKSFHVPVYFIGSTQVFSHRLLATGFDLAFYLFQVDVEHLSSLKHIYNYPDLKLLSFSFFHLIKNYPA